MNPDPDGPKVRCSLRIEFSSPEEAAKVHSAVELDNQGYVTTRVDGRALLADIQASSLNSLLHTLDDLLSCTTVAEKIISKKG
jgi:tRNA threonylcarbamoyladenosine modification (KEOPS) complex  Pcc1 subunit